MSTQRTVLFLGAGASNALGYPLTAEIFVQILARLKDRSLFPIGAESVIAAELFLRRR